MEKQITIDMHSHVIEPPTAKALNDALPEIGVTLDQSSVGDGALTVGGSVYRPFPRGGWDISKRIEDMDRYGLTRQVLSVCPQTVMYEEAPPRALIASQIQNNALADRVAVMPDRFLALATVPLQAPELAASELARAMSDNGLIGAMLCTNIAGKNLDWPNLDVFWAEAEARRAILLLHPPLKIAGAERLGDYYLRNLIGNPLDTTIAAACLVFGGVLERYPKLRFVLSHGGGFLPFQQDRWRHGWVKRPEAKMRLKSEPGPSIDRLFYDTILHGAPALQFLVNRAGSSRVMLGTDYPFDMGEYSALEVIASLEISEADRQELLAGSIERLLY